jgi:anti-anti-sigma regulatory factor
MDDYKYFRVEQHHDVTIVRLADPSSLSRLLIAEIEQELSRLIQVHNPRNLLISFEQVRSCTSELIAGLMIARNRMLSSGGTIKLCCMNDLVREVFQLVKLYGTVFEVYPTVTAALKSF